MEYSKTQEQIMHRLKTRGPQSVKILSKQLDMTTMGVRQHLTDLERKGIVDQTREEKQTRGRPVHLWKLTQVGHQYFPDSHSQVTLELIDVIRSTLGEESLNKLVDKRNEQLLIQYRDAFVAAGEALQPCIEKLAELRSNEGYMAEVRLIPGGWLLIENHCPICSAAENCQQFCRSELAMFQDLFSEQANVERVDHLLAGARRCAYRITEGPKPMNGTATT